MRALNVPSPGDQPIISDLPTPGIAADTVLVRVKAAGLNALDNAVAAGALAEMIPHEYPLVLGRDAAGVVEAVGEGVDNLSVGDHVVGHLPVSPVLREGALAEFALLPAATVTVIPEGIHFTTAAALPLAGAAAHAAVEAVEAAQGETVLVNGATGGVGGYVVQLLADQAVTVVATGTADDVKRLTARGATHVVDYSTGDVAEQVKELIPGGVDALVELVAYDASASPLAAVKQGGRVASSTGQPDAEALKTAGLQGTTIMANPASEVIGSLLTACTKNRLTVDVTTTLPLEEALDGLHTIAAGTARGKIVVTPER